MTDHKEQDRILKMIETLSSTPKHTREPYVRKLIKWHTSQPEERVCEDCGNPCKDGCACAVAEASKPAPKLEPVVLIEKLGSFWTELAVKEKTNEIIEKLNYLIIKVK